MSKQTSWKFRIEDCLDYRRNLEFDLKLDALTLRSFARFVDQSGEVETDYCTRCTVGASICTADPNYVGTSDRNTAWFRALLATLRHHYRDSIKRSVWASPSAPNSPYLHRRGDHRAPQCRR